MCSGGCGVASIDSFGSCCTTLVRELFLRHSMAETGLHPKGLPVSLLPRGIANRKRKRKSDLTEAELSSMGAGVPQVMSGSNVMNGELYPADSGPSLPTQSPVSEHRTSYGKQVAIPGFPSMSQDLKLKVVNLVQAWPTIPIHSKIGRVCRWLAIVQDRSPSKTHSYVFSLLNRNPPAITSCFNDHCRISFTRLGVYKGFCKAVVTRNMNFNVYSRILRDNNMLSFQLSSVSYRIRVLMLFNCNRLERVDLQNLPMLRSLSIRGCPNLKEIRGWESLSELGWLEITRCDELHGGHIMVHRLPLLKEFRFTYCDTSQSDGLEEFILDFSHCVHLRKIRIIGSLGLKNVHLSTSNCLEVLQFYHCPALETILSLSEAHSLMKVTLYRCPAVDRVPYLGELQALVTLKLGWSGAFTNTGFENLHRLTHLTLHSESAFETVLPGLSGLKHLKFLRLVLSGVEEIRGVDKLHVLSELSLSGCKALKSLPYLGDLKALRSLDICGCGVDEIPGVRELINLEKLDCRRSELEWLPDLRHLLRLRSMSLHDTPLVKVFISKYYGKPRGLLPVKVEEGGHRADEDEDVGVADYVPSDGEFCDLGLGLGSDDSEND